MTIQDYFDWKKQKRASENISEICLRQKHKEIAKELSKMLERK